MILQLGDGFAETADASSEEGIFPVNDPRGLTPSVNVGTGTVVFDDLGRFLRERTYSSNHFYST